MTNFEHFNQEIVTAIRDKADTELSSVACALNGFYNFTPNCFNNSDCKACMIDSLKWLSEEYDPDIIRDASNLKSFDEIMVRNFFDESWKKRNFAFYEDGFFWCYEDDERYNHGQILVSWHQAKCVKIDNFEHDLKETI